MPVTYLELENFKSYAGLQRIGPFHDFTSVIGPNGSGKSNLMDAMSFVLGVQSRDLRSSQMKDLIFRPPGVSDETARRLKASATLVYVDPERDNLEMRFSRTVSAQGVGEYRVDDETVPFKTYEEKLGEIGVLIKARNFLVFQGDVESIARKTPKQLVEMFEQISQSAELREEYDAALKAKEEAEAAAVFAFNKQKGCKSERRQLKDQKEEAERFDAMVERRAALQTEFFLWQLFHIHGDIAEREDAADELKKELQEMEGTVAEKEDALKAAKKVASKARRETTAADKVRVQLESDVDGLQPSVIKSTEEIKNLKKKVSSDERSLAKVKKQESKHGEKLAELEAEIAECQESETTLQRDYDALKQSGAEGEDGMTALTEEQEIEYAQVREAAAIAATKPREVLGRQNRRLEGARAKSAQLANDLKEVQARSEEAKQSVKEMTEHKVTLEKSLEKTKTDIEEAETELETVQKSAREAQARKEELDAEISKINATLREARDVRRKNKDEEKIAQAIEKLKSHFPGVHGRLVELCRPTQRRFNLAVTVAAGKDMDAVVVDTKQTGFDCIQYLREQRIGTATFLPLDTLQVPTPESADRIRAQAERDGRYRLAADVIASDDAHKRAVQYAVGNTIVCDNLDVAREICFSSGRGGEQARMKAVTLGGAVISKAGTMTGGVTKDESRAAGRWDEQKMEELRARKEELEAERSELDVRTGGGGRGRRGGRGSSSRRAEGSGLSHHARIEELRGTVGTLRNRDQFTKSNLEYTKTKLKEQVSLLNSTKKQVTKLEKELVNAEKEVEDANTKAQEAIQAVRDAEEEHFAPFREKTGLRDLRAYDEAMGKAREEFLKKRREIREHLAKLTAQKKYEDERDFTAPIAKAEKRLSDRKDKLEEAKKREADLQIEVAEAKAKLADAEATLKQAQEKEKEHEEVVRQAQKEFKDVQSEQSKVTKDINAEENALMLLRQKLHETLQKARVEEVELPIVSVSTAQRSSEEEEEDEEMAGDDEGEPSSERSSSQGFSQPLSQGSTYSAHFSQKDDSKVAKDRRDAGKVDFSKLDEKLKQRRSDREEKKLKKDFEDKISKLAADLEGMSPNMKAGEAYQTMTERLKESGMEFDAAKEESKKASMAFNKIKKTRSKRFNDAFNHIDDALKTIYTDMTKSSKHPLGGKAYLSLDNTEEPYKSGMKFNAMPPMKRFRDMEQLSGGEKTVASLSLLFAIHSFRPAPFFVMDEVDAALDNVNVLKVCNYIRQRSGDFQCIVISLKDMFYERSQSLIGICRDVGTNSSRTMTLDLRKFDRATDDDDDISEEARSGQKRARLSSASGLGSRKSLRDSSGTAVSKQ